MFDPRKLKPFSMELCNAPIAVITEMTEKTPIVMPSIVRAERSLFAPNELQAILMISRNNMPLFLLHRRARRDRRAQSSTDFLHRLAPCSWQRTIHLNSVMPYPISQLI